MFEVDVIQIPPKANMLGHHVITGNGHGFSVSVAEDPDALAYWGFPEEIVSRYDPHGLSPEQVDLAKRSRVFVGTVFPNLSFSVVPLTGNPHEQPPTAFVLLRLWQPRGPGTMELWNWILVSGNASPEFRDLSYRAGMGTLASSGMFDQDDAEPWQSMARTAGSAFARKVDYKLNYQLGRGVGTATALSDWPGPGLASSHRYEEGVQRAIYERWLDYLTCEDYPSSSPAPSWNGNGPNE
jgi:hypothetical protein